MGAALAARKQGVKDILIIERDSRAGGILPQCIHSGFGLHRFKKELTGPEYALKFYKQAEKESIEFRFNTMVIDIKKDKTIIMMSRKYGTEQIKAKAVILAMGCRERTRGAINIAGTRPAGVITAGTAQRFVNMEGYMPGKEVVILGSGDIGLIMARRMTLEGAKILAVCEIMPQSGGLQRNISQCLNDFNIPLMLSHTVCEIHGKERVEGVTVAEVDKDFKPIDETKRFIKCDTLMLSVGLIPENELSEAAGVILAANGGAETDEYMQTNVEGVFACGNVVHVHDLVDFVTEESEEAGKNAAKYILGEKIDGRGYKFRQKSEENEKNEPAENERELTCIVCPIGCRLSMFLDKNRKLSEIKGNKCGRGKTYAIEEFTAPRRVLTSTVRVEINGVKSWVPVKTSGTIPKELLMIVMSELKKTKMTKPFSSGETLIENLLGTGVDIVVTNDITDDII